MHDPESKRRQRRSAGMVAIALSTMLPWAIPSDGRATPIPAEDALASWLDDESPARGLQDGVDWTLDGSEIVTTANADGALVSDFSVSGDFEFTVRIEAIETPYDDDTVGLLFGYQDSSNHYRLGWEAGGSPDGDPPAGHGGTGARGLWLVVEQAETGTLLYNDPDLFRPQSTPHVFRVGRVGGDVYFTVTEASGAEVASATVSEASFMMGGVGFYSESQTARYGSMDLNSTTTGVPSQLGAGVLILVEPNPFLASTAIQFELTHRTSIVAQIYDVRGRTVRSLAAGSFAEGVHRVDWDGLDADGGKLSAGVYFFRVQGGAVDAAEKLVLLR
ncbi:T9SS type A sorting domain-containing protein [bacterium]|nr:T9SS type A sorting domain-containing protein [bacterium]